MLSMQTLILLLVCFYMCFAKSFVSSSIHNLIKLHGSSVSVSSLIDLFVAFLAL